jgi:uncharacterized membrane protein YhaH (DUF805 family)
VLRRPPREKEWRSWLWVALWTMVIYLTIPLARSIQGFVQDSWGRTTFAYAVLLAIAVSASGTVVYLRRERASGRTRYVWLLAISAIFVWYTFVQLRKTPEEGMHFVQYGVLGVLVYRAFTHRVRNVGIYFAAALVGAILGTVDEAIQWATPRRYWGLHDIWMNFFACALVQVAIAKGLKPAIISGPPSAATVRLLCSLSATALLVLGASLLNTPPRIAWYAERVPLLGYLKTNESVMFEYGYLYQDPEIGRFRSRFTVEALLDTDRRRGAEVAAILDRYRDRSTYESFLRRFNPVSDPLAHEARVHLFRRDIFLNAAKRFRHREKDYHYHLWVAYRENQILQKYFPRTLAHSSYVLSPDQLAHMRDRLLTDRHYESPVSRSLQTVLSEGQVLGALILALVALVAVRRVYGRER